MCPVRGEPGVAKNPAEQEELCALGPRSDCDCQITVWAGGALSACPLGHPSPCLKSWGQPLGCLQGLSPVKEKCLYLLEDAAVSWHQWCGTSGRAALLLLPPVWSTAPCTAAVSWHRLPVLPVLGRQCVAAGAVSSLLARCKTMVKKMQA